MGKTLLLFDIILSNVFNSIFRAAVMSGRHVGVQTILHEQYMTRAIHIHCFIYKLNLLICDVLKVVPYLSEFSSIVSKVYIHFHTSSVPNLCVLALERNFSIDFEKFMDDCANLHKDNRI